MKYQLFIGNSCDNLNLVSKSNFDYTHNVNLQVVSKRDYIIKVVKHSNGNSRYSIAYNFIANKDEVIHGHTFDPVANNTTLLGIDVNDNGVRDDVERWIYHTYRDKHPIYVDIAMQGARGWQKVLEDPTKAKEIHDEVSAPMYCEAYYKNDAKYFNEQLLIEEDINTKYFRQNIVFNTEERKNAYWQYDTLLSGDSYALPKSETRKQLCDFNTSKYEE